MKNKKLPSKREVVPASSEATSRKRTTYTDEFKRTTVTRHHSVASDNWTRAQPLSRKTRD